MLSLFTSDIDFSFFKQFCVRKVKDSTNSFQVHLPSTSTRSVESGNETVTLAPNHGDLFLPNSTLSSENCDLFTCLLPVIDQAHTLWELILTAEPLGKW